MLPLLYIGLSQTVFAAFLVITKKPRVLADLVLAFWLLLIASETYISLYIETIRLTSAALNFSVLIQLAYMPIMFIYVKTLSSEYPRLSPKELFHFVPHFVFLLWLLLFLKDEPIFYGSPENWPRMGHIYRTVFAIHFFLSICYYSFMILKSIRQHQQENPDRFSYTSGGITLNWLKFIQFLFVISFTTMIVMALFADVANYPFDPRFFIRTSLTIFAFGVSFFGVRQPALFKPSPEEIPQDKENKTRYEKSGLSESLARLYEERLQTYMEEEKPYLNPELTIKDISDHLNISRHHITQVLNERINKNFYNYINEFRLAEVKKRLVDPRYSHLTLIAIAYDSGFNSKSAFNSIFKKATGMTPSEYRQVQS